MRDEDLISNRFKLLLSSTPCIRCMNFKLLIVYLDYKLSRDRDLLLVPYSSSDISVIQWPPFLLASKVYYYLSGFLKAGRYYN